MWNKLKDGYHGKSTILKKRSNSVSVAAKSLLRFFVALATVFC